MPASTINRLEQINISQIPTFGALALSEEAADFGSARIRLGEKESAVIPYHRPLIVNLKFEDQGWSRFDGHLA